MSIDLTTIARSSQPGGQTGFAATIRAELVAFAEATGPRLHTMTVNKLGAARNPRKVASWIPKRAIAYRSAITQLIPREFSRLLTLVLGACADLRW